VDFLPVVKEFFIRQARFLRDAIHKFDHGSPLTHHFRSVAEVTFFLQAASRSEIFGLPV
jgi:hypothetical protein